jgi:hypothetical protein
MHSVDVTADELTDMHVRVLRALGVDPESFTTMEVLPQLCAVMSCIIAMSPNERVFRQMLEDSKVNLTTIAEQMWEDHPFQSMSKELGLEGTERLQ